MMIENVEPATEKKYKHRSGAIVHVIEFEYRGRKYEAELTRTNDEVFDVLGVYHLTGECSCGGAEYCSFFDSDKKFTLGEIITSHPEVRAALL